MSIQQKVDEAIAEHDYARLLDLRCNNTAYRINPTLVREAYQDHEKNGEDDQIRVLKSITDIPYKDY